MVAMQVVTPITSQWVCNGIISIPTSNTRYSLCDHNNIIVIIIVIIIVRRPV